MKMVAKATVMVVDDDQLWLSRLREILSPSCDVLSFDSFETAERFIGSADVTKVSAAVVDVRLRKQIYDQGGLAILHLLKASNNNLPILVLTSYSSDYPGIRNISQRYPYVLTYEKVVFDQDPQQIISALLAQLPPQIGDLPTRISPADFTKKESVEVQNENRTGSLREIAPGILVIALLFAATLGFFKIARTYTEFPWELDVVFAIAMIAVVCVVLRMFTPHIVYQALSIYKDLLPSHRGKRHNYIPTAEPRRSKRRLP